MPNSRSFNQFPRLCKRSNISEFLLRIDERWGSKEIIKARKIIHKIYTKASKTVKETYRENATKEDVYQMVSKEIRSISDGSQKEKTDGDFINLLNLLDFMETIAFLEAEGRVTKEKLEALCGKSLIFNYKIFEYYIRHKRKKHNDEEYFQNFENLYNKLTTSKNNKSYE